MVETSNQENARDLFDVTVSRDVCFGIGGVGFSSDGGSERTQELLMDVYAPAATKVGVKLPALVLAFGGAFHRGSKDDDAFEDGEWRNTSIAQYCRRFASCGFVCFSVGYRLTGEAPDPGPQRWLTDPESISRSRMDHVRGLLGLPPATGRILANGMEAAFNYVSAAFNYFMAHSARYDIDVSRIAIGGFSAGGTSALYAAFACGVPAAAVVALSGRMEAADIQHYINGSNSTPILQIVGEHDLEYVRKLSLEQAVQCAKVGAQHTLLEVQGAGHFYPQQAKVIGPDGQISTVDRSILEFMETSLSKVY
jgi:dienelactone hydrolase